MSSHRLATRRVALTTSALLLALSVGACGTTPAPDRTSPPPATAVAQAVLVLDDGWVKAVDVAGNAMASPAPGSTPSAGMPGMGAMTAMFGTLRNTSDRDVTVTGATSPDAGRVELHETVKNASGAMQMQPMTGGLTLPAGGTHVLEPGGDHVMLMQLARSLESGTTTTVTFTTDAGDVVLTVPVRAFSGADESYAPTPSQS